MIRTFIRIAKRLAVLVPILVVAYLSVFNIFPLFNDHLPVVVALVFTYVLGAYVLVPAFIRTMRILFPVTHVPYYSVTRDGFASDPLNIGILATREELIGVMQAAGWHAAEKLTFKTAIRISLSTIYDWHYPTAPVSALYLFGRKQDEAFQIPINNGSVGSRHHVRFWATTYNDNEALTVRSINWQHRQAHLQSDRLLWVGAASRDIGVTFIRHSAQLTHLVDSDTNAERDLIVQQLQSASLAKRKRTITLEEPYQLPTIRGLTGHLRTDGKMIVMEVTAQKTASN